MTGGGGTTARPGRKDSGTYEGQINVPTRKEEGPEVLHETRQEVRIDAI